MITYLTRAIEVNPSSTGAQSQFFREGHNKNQKLKYTSNKIMFEILMSGGCRCPDLPSFRRPCRPAFPLLLRLRHNYLMSTGLVLNFHWTWSPTSQLLRCSHINLNPTTSFSILLCRRGNKRSSRVDLYYVYFYYSFYCFCILLLRGMFHVLFEATIILHKILGIRFTIST